ncbi:MAG: ABC transporter substrate-binding protein [Lachnospiraceae bacterium]|nr:ABC transporter substrate-binding protein [Lachnospiraceae bacterium]
MKNMRKLKKLLSPMLISALALSIGSTAFADDTIKIGVITNGMQSPIYTECMTNAGNLVASEYNENGGLLGKQVEIVPADGGLTADEAINAANMLISRGDISAVYGCPTSIMVMGCESLFGDAQVPLLMGGTSVKIHDETDNMYLFRCRPSDSISARIAATLLVEEMGCKNLGVIYENSDFGQGALTIFQEYADEQGVSLLGEGYNTTDQDITSQALKLKEAGVDGILVWANSGNVPMIASALYAQGLDVPVCGNGGTCNSQVQSSCQPEWIDGWYGLTDVSVDKDDETMKAFIAKYKEAYGEDAYIEDTVATGYSEASWICDAIERAGSADPVDVAEALYATEGFEGLTGVFKLRGDKVDFAGTNDIVRQVMKDGEMTLEYDRTVSVD